MDGGAGAKWDEGASHLLAMMFWLSLRMGEYQGMDGMGPAVVGKGNTFKVLTGKEICFSSDLTMGKKNGCTMVQFSNMSMLNPLCKKRFDKLDGIKQDLSHVCLYSRNFSSFCCYVWFAFFCNKTSPHFSHYVFDFTE